MNKGNQSILFLSLGVVSFFSGTIRFDQMMEQEVLSQMMRLLSFQMMMHVRTVRTIRFDQMMEQEVLSQMMRLSLLRMMMYGRTMELECLL